MCDRLLTSYPSTSIHFLDKRHPEQHRNGDNWKKFVRREALGLHFKHIVHVCQLEIIDNCSINRLLL
ncbi:unnamed protein product [Cylicocyclus nassatus]|uniref:Uncharacterized protein n=1 Tax=Cylicocyclus nassatus TaxID=53992 RepID=A0AA36DNQ3_CYLNA|nr:unnamed protein product [Cylicocyclus nassatus]